MDASLPVAELRPYQGGIPSLPALQASFPDAARAALAAETAAGTGDGGGLTGFLRAQLGVRSLSPQDGDGTDAILSRAEAALHRGDLSAALTEVQALGGPAADALASWRTDAETRQAALAAYAALAAKVQN